MKRLLIIVIFILIAPSIALAKDLDKFWDNTYLSIGGGLSVPSNNIKHLVPVDYETDDYRSKKFQTSAIYKASVGKSFNSFRAELEFLFSRKHKLKFNTTTPRGLYDKSELHISNRTYFLNGFYDLKNFSSILTPYVTLGAGVSSTNLSDEICKFSSDNVDYPVMKILGKKSTSFAWNAGVGLMMNINKNIAIDLSYKYLDLGKLRASKYEMMLDGSDNLLKGENYNVKGRLRSSAFLTSLVIKF
jgi:opacity protein-like surface antigen